MADTKMELSEARVRLAALVEARSKANCSSHHSSEADMRREAEIEDVISGSTDSFTVNFEVGGTITK